MNNIISIEKIEGLKYREIFEILTGEKITRENHNFTKLVDDVGPLEKFQKWIFGPFYSVHSVISEDEDFRKETFLTCRKAGNDIDVYDIIYFDDGYAKHWGPVKTNDPKWQDRLYLALNHFVYERGGKE